MGVSIMIDLSTNLQPLLGYCRALTKTMPLFYKPVFYKACFLLLPCPALSQPKGVASYLECQGGLALPPTLPSFLPLSLPLAGVGMVNLSRLHYLVGGKATHMQLCFIFSLESLNVCGIIR